MAYADDINIMGKSMTAVKEIYIDLDKWFREVGLNINVDKTKVLKQTRTKRSSQNVTIGNDILEAVKHFKYLRIDLASDGNEETEINGRITK